MEILIVIASLLMSAGAFIIGREIGKQERRVKLNGLNAKTALAYFLSKEKIRHIEDIIKIDRDLIILEQAGIKVPDDIPLNLWIETE